MNNWMNNVRHILNGTRLLENKKKYRVFSISLSMIHLFYGLMMLVLGVTPLVIYNIVVVIFYIFVGFILTAREAYLTMFVACVTEILLYSSIATIMLGWQCGFMNYTVGIVPAAFYLTYTLPGMEKKMSLPVLTAVDVGVCNLAIHVVERSVSPLVYGISASVVEFFYCFNTVLTFGMLILFSLFFALEVRYMQRMLERENSKLGKMANFDPLTKLYNRRSMERYLDEAMHQAVEHQKIFCLMMADIDDFKKVNDTYGHDCGDEVLVAVSQILSSNVREGDRVCRWGGEEFLVLFETNLEMAERIAQRIRKQVEAQELEAGSKIVKVSVTMGIAEYKETATIPQLVEEADQNLYFGKRHGKNQVVI
jgi:diguanylate cyclase (GGDEF)-like protein